MMEFLESRGGRFFSMESESGEPIWMARPRKRPTRR